MRMILNEDYFNNNSIVYDGSVLNEDSDKGAYTV